MQENELSGVLNINKPSGMTSHDVVNKIRRLYGIKRVGHTGTLDPIATGVLVILVGRAAKASEYIVSADKRYRAGLRLGVTTDTGDSTGRILTQTDMIPPASEIDRVVHSFQGEIQQIPPMYSALKIKGSKLVDLARKGIIVERESRTVNIYSVAATTVDETTGCYSLDIHCSKGTYIRTFCEEIGAALGCGGVMDRLERMASGNFSIENAFTIEQIDAMTEAERVRVLFPVEELFTDYPMLKLDGFLAKLARSGAEIYQSKTKTDFKVGRRLRIYDENGFLALGEVYNYTDGSAVKPIKHFRI